jgi:thioredoxin-like negative regulator of GroEL
LISLNLACGHCKLFASEWDAVAIALKGKITLGKINGIEEKELADAYRILKFPSVKLFRR